MNEEALAHWGLLRQKKERKKRNISSSKIQYCCIKMLCRTYLHLVLHRYFSSKIFSKIRARESTQHDIFYFCIICWKWCGTSKFCVVPYVKVLCRCVIFNPLKPELNPICYLLALLGAHHFLHVSRIRVKLLTLR